MMFSCPNGQTYTASVSGYDVPACTAGQGTWKVEAVPFDPSTLDVAQLADAWGAGFIIAGIPLGAILACRYVLKAING